MKRTDLMNTLKRAEHALGSKDLVPVFQCFLFDGKHALAYNDVVAISVPCPFEIKGGLNGRLLLDWLAACRSNDVAVVPKKDEIQLKGGRSKLNLPLVDSEDFIFEFPKERGHKLTMSEDVVSMIEAVAISMGTDANNPWRLGITVDFKNGKATFYSSDNISASRGNLAVKIGKPLNGKAVILPPRFVELLLSFQKKDAAKTLIFGNGWIEASFESGLRLWSKMISEIEPDTFRELFAAQLGKKSPAAITIPRGLDSCLDRVRVMLTHAKLDNVAATVKKGTLKLFADSQLGQVEDMIRIKDHPDVEEKISPTHIARALPHCGKILILADKCVYLSGGAEDEFEYIVALVRD